MCIIKLKPDVAYIVHFLNNQGKFVTMFYAIVNGEVLYNSDLNKRWQKAHSNLLCTPNKLATFLRNNNSVLVEEKPWQDVYS